MAFIPAPNCAVAALRGDLNGVAIVNTLWFEGSTPYDAGACLSVAQALQEWWRDYLKIVQVPTFTMNEIQVYAMDSLTAPTATEVVGESGTDAGEAAANQAAMVVTFRTAGRGRSSRGRNYVGGFSEADLSNNAWTTGVLDVVTQAYNDFPAYVGSINGSTHVVVSRYSQGAPRVQGLPQPVTSYDIQARPGTIRQRTGR